MTSAELTLISSYRPGDLALTMVAASPPTVGLDEKERRIGAGESYGHFLTPERPPSAVQTRTYHTALARSGARVAADTLRLARDLRALAAGRPITLLSLARAGFPVGVLLGRQLRAWGLDAAHYGVSIIRGVGLDQQALAQVRAARPGSTLVFVDGWTGKGSIRATLHSSLHGAGLPPTLAVLSDPAGVADLRATHDDYLLPHAALNATVSGLISRTFLRPGGAHAAARLDHLSAWDLSASYVDALWALMERAAPSPPETRPAPRQAAAQALAIAAGLGVGDPHRAKPSLGEATRVLLRRRAAGVVLRARTPETAHLEELAAGLGLPVYLRPQLPYAALGLIAALEAQP